MTRDDIMRIAREAGWSGIYSKPLMSITLQEDEFLRFAALVAAAEREACAKVCDGWAKYGIPAVASCASEIRARGEK